MQRMKKLDLDTIIITVRWCTQHSSYAIPVISRYTVIQAEDIIFRVLLCVTSKPHQYHCPTVVASPGSAYSPAEQGAGLNRVVRKQEATTENIPQDRHKRRGCGCSCRRSAPAHVFLGTSWSWSGLRCHTPPGEHINILARECLKFFDLTD